MEKEIIDDIEIFDDVDIIDDIKETPSNDEVVDLLSDFEDSTKSDSVYSSDLGIEVIEEKEEKIADPVVPVIELPEEVVVEDIMSKTYNLAEVLKTANEELVEEKDEIDGKKSAIFIGVLFALLVVFVLALPYIAKFMMK